MFAFPESEFEDFNYGMASIRVREIVTVTRWTLEAYIADRSLPEWTDLPTRPAAMRWVFGKRTTETT